MLCTESLGSTPGRSNLKNSFFSSLLFHRLLSPRARTKLNRAQSQDPDVFRSTVVLMDVCTMTSMLPFRCFSPAMTACVSLFSTTSLGGSSTGERLPFAPSMVVVTLLSRNGVNVHLPNAQFNTQRLLVGGAIAVSLLKGVSGC